MILIFFLEPRTSQRAKAEARLCNTSSKPRHPSRKTKEQIQKKTKIYPTTVGVVSYLFGFTATVSTTGFGQSTRSCRPRPGVLEAEISWLAPPHCAVGRITEETPKPGLPWSQCVEHTPWKILSLNLPSRDFNLGQKKTRPETVVQWDSKPCTLSLHVRLPNQIWLLSHRDLTCF